MKNTDICWEDVWAHKMKDDASKFDAPTPKERPPIAEALLCEAAACGHYDQQLLTKLTGRDWADCTKALMDGLSNGLVDNTSGTAILTVSGQFLLDETRRTQGPLTTRAVIKIAKTLDDELKRETDTLAKAADEVRGVNDALERLLEGDK